MHFQELIGSLTSGHLNPDSKQNTIPADVHRNWDLLFDEISFLKILAGFDEMLIELVVAVTHHAFIDRPTENNEVIATDKLRVYLIVRLFQLSKLITPPVGLDKIDLMSAGFIKAVAMRIHRPNELGFVAIIAIEKICGLNEQALLRMKARKCNRFSWAYQLAEMLSGTFCCDSVVAKVAPALKESSRDSGPLKMVDRSSNAKEPPIDTKKEANNEAEAIVSAVERKTTKAEEEAEKFDEHAEQGGRVKKLPATYWHAKVALIPSTFLVTLSSPEYSDNEKLTCAIITIKELRSRMRFFSDGEYSGYDFSMYVASVGPMTLHRDRIDYCVDSYGVAATAVDFITKSFRLYFSESKMGDAASPDSLIGLSQLLRACVDLYRGMVIFPMQCRVAMSDVRSDNRQWHDSFFISVMQLLEILSANPVASDVEKELISRYYREIAEFNISNPIRVIENDASSENFGEIIKKMSFWVDDAVYQPFLNRHQDEQGWINALSTEQALSVMNILLSESFYGEVKNKKCLEHLLSHFFISIISGKSSIYKLIPDHDARQHLQRCCVSNGRYVFDKVDSLVGELSIENARFVIDLMLQYPHNFTIIGGVNAPNIDDSQRADVIGKYKIIMTKLFLRVTKKDPKDYCHPKMLEFYACQKQSASKVGDNDLSQFVVCFSFSWFHHSLEKYVNAPVNCVYSSIIVSYAALFSELFSFLDYVNESLVDVRDLKSLGPFLLVEWCCTSILETAEANQMIAALSSIHQIKHKTLCSAELERAILLAVTGCNVKGSGDQWSIIGGLLNIHANFDPLDETPLPFFSPFGKLERTVSLGQFEAVTSYCCQADIPIESTNAFLTYFADFCSVTDSFCCGALSTLPGLQWKDVIEWAKLRLWAHRVFGLKSGPQQRFNLNFMGYSLRVSFSNESIVFERILSDSDDVRAGISTSSSSSSKERVKKKKKKKKKKKTNQTSSASSSMSPQSSLRKRIVVKPNDCALDFRFWEYVRNYIKAILSNQFNHIIPADIEIPQPYLDSGIAPYFSMESNGKPLQFYRAVSNGNEREVVPLRLEPSVTFCSREAKLNLFFTSSGVLSLLSSTHCPKGNSLVYQLKIELDLLGVEPATGQYDRIIENVLRIVLIELNKTISRYNDLFEAECFHYDLKNKSDDFECWIKPLSDLFSKLSFLFSQTKKLLLPGSSADELLPEIFSVAEILISHHKEFISYKAPLTHHFLCSDNQYELAPQCVEQLKGLYDLCVEKSVRPDSSFSVFFIKKYETYKVLAVLMEFVSSLKTLRLYNDLDRIYEVYKKLDRYVNDVRLFAGEEVLKAAFPVLAPTLMGISASYEAMLSQSDDSLDHPLSRTGYPLGDINYCCLYFMLNQLQELGCVFNVSEMSNIRVAADLQQSMQEDKVLEALSVLLSSLDCDLVVSARVSGSSMVRFIAEKACGLNMEDFPVRDLDVCVEVSGLNQKLFNDFHGALCLSQEKKLSPVWNPGFNNGSFSFPLAVEGGEPMKIDMTFKSYPAPSDSKIFRAHQFELYWRGPKTAGAQCQWRIDGFSFKENLFAEENLAHIILAELVALKQTNRKLVGDDRQNRAFCMDQLVIAKERLSWLQTNRFTQHYNKKYVMFNRVSSQLNLDLLRRVELLQIQCDINMSSASLAAVLKRLSAWSCVALKNDEFSKIFKKELAQHPGLLKAVSAMASFSGNNIVPLVCHQGLSVAASGSYSGGAKTSTKSDDDGKIRTDVQTFTPVLEKAFRILWGKLDCNPEFLILCIKGLSSLSRFVDNTASLKCSGDKTTASSGGSFQMKGI